MTIRPSRLTAVFAAGVIFGAAPTAITWYTRYHHACDRDENDNAIVMATSEDVHPGRHRQELIKEWNQKNPDAPVRLVEIRGGADIEYSQLLADQQLHGCAYDVMSLDIVWIPEFIRDGYLEPFPTTEFRKEDFLDKPWKSGIGASDHQQYAIPFHTDVGLLYYRKDIIPEPPRTWAELRAAITPENIAQLEGPNPAGLVTQLSDYEGLTVNAMEAVWGAGGVLQAGTSAVNVDPVAAKALSSLIDDENNPAYGTAPRIVKESVAYREADTVAAFAQGRALFLRNWPYAYSALLAEPSLKDKIGVAQLPGPARGMAGAGALGGQGLVIPHNSQHKQRARDLIRFLTDEQQQRQLFACGGYVPVRVDVYRGVQSCSQLPGQVATTESADPVSQGHLNVLASILTHALDNARLRPSVPYYPGFSRAFHRFLHDAILSNLVIKAPDLARRLTTCSGWTAPSPACP